MSFIYWRLAAGRLVDHLPVGSQCFRPWLPQSSRDPSYPEGSLFNEFLVLQPTRRTPKLQKEPHFERTGSDALSEAVDMGASKNQGP